MTPSEFELIKRKLPIGPGVSKLNNPRPASPVPNPEPEPAVLNAPARPDARKESGATRVKVRIVSLRCRLLDIDNLAGGSKFLLDALRYDGLIRDDCPDAIDLTVSQIKVAKRCDEETLIFIERIPEIDATEAAQFYAKTLNELKL